MQVLLFQCAVKELGVCPERLQPSFVMTFLVFELHGSSREWIVDKWEWVF